MDALGFLSAPDGPIPLSSSVVSWGVAKLVVKSLETGLHGHGRSLAVQGTGLAVQEELPKDWDE